MYKILTALAAFAICLSLFFATAEINVTAAGVSLFVGTLSFVASSRIKQRPGDWRD